MNPKAPTLDDAKGTAISCFKPGQRIPSCHILLFVSWSPELPCSDPSDEIMKSQRLVRSDCGTVLDTEGTTSFVVLEYRIDRSDRVGRARGLQRGNKQQA